MPPYSPDLNPIEQFFAKLKALLRKAAARTLEALIDAIACALTKFKPHECENYLDNSGYRHRLCENALGYRDGDIGFRGRGGVPPLVIFRPARAALLDAGEALAVVRRRPGPMLKFVSRQRGSRHVMRRAKEKAAALHGKKPIARVPHIEQVRRSDISHWRGRNFTCNYVTQPQENPPQYRRAEKSDAPKTGEALQRKALSVPTQAKSNSLAASRTIEKKGAEDFHAKRSQRQTMNLGQFPHNHEIAHHAEADTTCALAPARQAAAKPVNTCVQFGPVGLKLSAASSREARPPPPRRNCERFETPA